MASTDLSVTKTASTSTATVGQQFTYTMTVRNNGPDPATGVVLSDPVPAGACLNSISTSPQVGSYTYTGNTITWNIGNLNVNSSATLSLSATAAAAGALVNTSIVTGNESDPDPTNNSSTATITVTGVSTPSADVAIWKDSCPRVVNAGASFVYTVSAINNGPSQAYDVVVTDSLPPGLIPQSATSSKGVCTISGSTVTCQIGNLLLNERVSISIVVLPVAAGVFQNTASITSGNIVPDQNLGNNTASVITEVIPATDLAITKTASVEAVTLGATLTYTVIITNNGPANADAVIVTESLDPSVTVLSISASQGSGCTPIGSNEYLCSLGTMASSATATITIIVKPTEPGCITNTASVSSSTIEIDPCNNTASTCTLVKRPEIDLVVTKTHSPEHVAVCTPVTYTLTVTNNGPSPATGVVLVDQLPASMQVLSVCASQGQCHNGGQWQSCSCCGKKTIINKDCFHSCKNEMVCQLGSLAIGGSATVRICVKPCQPGTITNTAVVTANEEDLNPSNNQAIDTIAVSTLSEQVDYLIGLVRELVITGIILEENAACLLATLESAKQFIACGSMGNPDYYLGYFIKNVACYISQGILPSDAGYLLINIAEAVKSQLGCGQNCLRQGDEFCEQS